MARQKREKTVSGRQGLDWAKAKSFETAAKRLAATYNSFVEGKYDQQILDDQLEGIKKGTYIKARDMKGKIKNFNVFDTVFKVNDKTGKLEVRNDQNARKIFERWADNAGRTKTIFDQKKNKDVDVEDKTYQALRVIYETTDTATAYKAKIEDFVKKGLSEYSDPDVNLLEKTISKTADNIQKHNPAVDRQAAEDRARQIKSNTQKAIQEEMIKRATFKDKVDTSIDAAYKDVSEALRSGKFDRADLKEFEGLAWSAVNHSGAQSSFADVEMILTISEML